MHYQFLRLETALEISKDYPKKIGEDLFFYKKLIELSKRYSEISVRRAIEERALGDWVGYYGKPLELKDEITSFLSKEFDVKKSQAIKKKLLSLAEYEKSRSAPVFNYIDDNYKNHTSKELIGKVVYIYVWHKIGSKKFMNWAFKMDFTGYHTHMNFKVILQKSIIFRHYHIFY